MTSLRTSAWEAAATPNQGKGPGKGVVFAALHLYFLKCSDCSQENLITVRAHKNKHIACILSNDRRDHSITVRPA